MKQSKTWPGMAGQARGWPRFTLLALALCVGASLFAGWDLSRTRQSALAATDERLRALARVATALYSADEARIHALLARLRIELRTRGDWAHPEALAPGAAGGLRPVRSIDNLLRRALEGAPELRAFELVVTGPDGLALARVEPGAGPPAQLEASEREARARALWYADEVQAAIDAQGRRVARSAVESAPASAPGGRGESEPAAAAATARVRAVIALHEGDEVMQGVLVAHLDLAALGTRLASLSSPELRFALLTPDGHPIGESPATALGSAASRIAEQTSEPAALPPIAEADGLRSLLVRAQADAGSTSPPLFWIEAPAPPGLVSALRSGGWPVAFFALCALAVAAWSRDRAPSAASSPAPARAAAPAREVERRPRDETPAIPSEAALARAAVERSEERAQDATGPREPATTEDAVRPERFVLRDWLADVRGCLEREAASRGLTLVLRCDRMLPREVELDPNWLGGLLVALGREALDATRASRVALDVYPADPSGLRFEFDAGETAFEAVPGMRAAAARLGARLECAGRGRLAIALPCALG